MVVIEIEDNDGSSIGAFRVVEENNKTEITDFKDHLLIGKNISYADSDEDYFFDTDDELIRIQLICEEDSKIKNPYRSANYIGFYHENDEVIGLVQELASYRRLLKSFDEGDYYNCGVLIENYFGHIDYWYQFGYNKTHAEIVSILHTNLLSEISGNTANSFTSFCERQINKIIGSLEDDYNIEDVDKLMEENWLP